MAFLGWDRVPTARSNTTVRKTKKAGKQKNGRDKRIAAIKGLEGGRGGGQKRKKGRASQKKRGKYGHEHGIAQERGRRVQKQRPSDLVGRQGGSPKVKGEKLKSADQNTTRPIFFYWGILRRDSWGDWRKGENQMSFIGRKLCAMKTGEKKRSRDWLRPGLFFAS